MENKSSTKNTTSGEIKISCTTCNFEGRWHKGIGPAYTPEDGCHKSIISSGWCDSCKTITTQYTGQAGTYDLSDYGVQNKYERHGPPETDRGILGTLDGGGLPWAGAEWRLKELKTELRVLITENEQLSGPIQRLFRGRRLRKNSERIQQCHFEAEECEEAIRLYKVTQERATRDQEAANAFFGLGRPPRCLECSSHDVKIRMGNIIPHICGTPLEFEQRTIERTSLAGIQYSYYDNNGLVVRTEVKPLY